MLIQVVNCRECDEPVLVDERLWQIGTIELHCGSCGADFLPDGSPGTGSAERAANANVPIRIWGRDRESTTE